MDSQAINDVQKQVRKIEDRLKKRLAEFYKSDIVPYTELMPAESIRHIHEKQIKALIRKTVQDSYLMGTGTVGQTINDKRPFDLYITTRDIKNITDLTDDLNISFWQEITRLVGRENDFIVKDHELEKKKSFDADAALNSISAYVTFKSFNNAVLSKSKVLTNQQQSAGARLEVDIMLPPDEPRVEFLTQEDEKVCNEFTNPYAPCEPWNRRQFRLFDPDIPIPPLHRYCRCILVPLI